MLSLAGAAGGAAAVAGASETDGFSAGRAAGLASACLVSAGLNAFGSGLDSAFGLAGAVDAVVSAAALPKPTLWARLANQPSDCLLSVGAADATRVGAGCAAGVEATPATGSSACCHGARGGLTVPGIVPGMRERLASARPCPSPPSERPVLAPGTW